MDSRSKQNVLSGTYCICFTNPYIKLLVASSVTCEYYLKGTCTFRPAAVYCRSLAAYIALWISGERQYLCFFSSGVTRGLSHGGRLSWSGSTKQHSEKGWEMIVNADVDAFTKSVNHRKILRKTWKNKNLLKTKKLVPKIQAKWVFSFYIWLAREGGSHSCFPSVRPLLFSADFHFRLVAYSWKPIKPTLNTLLRGCKQYQIVRKKQSVVPTAPNGDTLVRWTVTVYQIHVDCEQEPWQHTPLSV